MTERTAHPPPTKGNPDEAGTRSLLEELRELEQETGATLFLYRKHKSPGRCGKVHWSVVADLDFAPDLDEEHAFGYHCVEVVPQGGLLSTEEAVALVLSLRFDHYQLARHGFGSKR